MLEYLRIRDLALIEDMELDFAPGMNVLTGETGAGKSFILKAIQFLLGEKLDSDLVRQGAEKAQAEAIFLVQGEELILRRELMAGSGRSRFFLNGNVTSQESVRSLRSSLVLHAGQHGQQRLLQPAYQSLLVDSFIKDTHIIAEKDAILKALKDISEQKKELIQKVETLKDRRELLEMQQREIEKVSPEEGEEERLEALRQEYRGMEHIQEMYEKGLEILHGNGGEGLVVLLGQLERLLASAQDDSFRSAYEALLNFQEEVRDLGQRFRTVPMPDFSEDPEEIESRLFALAQLKRKLNRSLPEIIQLRDEVAENLSFLDVCNLDLHRLAKKEKELAEKLFHSLELVNTEREKAAKLFCSSLEQELSGLGFSEKVQVIPELIEQTIWPSVSGTPVCIEKKVHLLWAPNPGQRPQALDKIASGGELSRFLLAVVGLQQAQAEEAILIFDEVDAGIGGITLNRVSERLESLAAKRQMLLITHWPQLAIRGNRHFCVSKEIIGEITFTRCVKLDEKARKEELARMEGKE